jgi:hypothetical protein
VIKPHGGRLVYWRGARLDVCEFSTRLEGYGGPTVRRLGTPTPSVCSGCGVSRATALRGVLTRWIRGLGLFCWGSLPIVPSAAGGLTLVGRARGLSAATWWKGFWLSSAGVLLEGLRPPSVVMRPEVYDVVVKWWRVYGHPFVSVKYLRS